MGSKVISFRVPDDLYDEFEQKCKEEKVSLTVKLRELIGTACHPGEVDTEDKVPVKVIEVEGDTLEKIAGRDSKKRSWFPLDFSPLFGKD